MERERLNTVLEEIGKVRIAVIGDFCLDTYWFIDESMSEISIETGEPTQPVKEQRYSLGGAGNVANNLVAIGVKDVRAFGVIGPDPFGSEMVRIMRAAGINTLNLLVQEGSWHTHTYSKPYVGDKELSRVDFGNFNRLSDTTADMLLSNLDQEIPGLDIILINQQVPSGIHNGYLRSGLLGLIRKYPDKPFITDSRNFNDFYDGTIRKMNDVEALRLCGIKKNPGDLVTRSEALSAAGKLFARYQRPVFITRGEKGSVTIDRSGVAEIPGLWILSKTDTVGAGDSYLSGVSSALAAGYDMETAATLGNFAAGVTVQKLFQTGTATPAEILSIGQDPDYVYSPELADDIRQARYLGHTEIEVIRSRDEKLRMRHAIFDHDGTISTLREGWELIMTPMMIRTVLGDKYPEADEAVYQKVQARVREFIEKTTGIQTLVQMKGLVNLVREFGFVPDEKILDEYGYKEIYNEELLKMVRDREEKLKRGELAVEDLTVKNAVPFLRVLKKAGISLYLASGTDVGDVRNEARILGYEDVFEERIYGAVGDITMDAKKMVLDHILDAIGMNDFGEVATFGDGPVEIRETRKRGGIAIGIASDELKRFGLNVAKRTRLIQAGADLIMPDFSQYPHLLGLLNIVKGA